MQETAELARFFGQQQRSEPGEWQGFHSGAACVSNENRKGRTIFLQVAPSLSTLALGSSQIRSNE
jgi:hypothetical protein